MSAGPRRTGAIAPPLALAMVFAVASAWAAIPHPGPPLASVRAIARAMSGGQSGSAEVRYVLVDPLGGPARTVRGRVRVETPDRVRLDFTSGERITLRADGGEWLQPATRQLLRIPAARARTALQWWRVLLPDSRATFREDTLAPGRYVLTPKDSAAGGIPVEVRLAADGLPAALTVNATGDAPTTYRLSKWSFGPAKGESDFRLTAPAGYETVDLP